MKFKIELVEIIENRPVGMGDRCCIDLVGKYSQGEGLLVGMMSRGMFLIYNESFGSPFTTPRPFRVNAGPVSAYTFVSGNGKEKKTKYLWELSSGDKVLVVDYKGDTREVEVGRNKIERRPFLLIKARSKKLASQAAKDLGVIGVGQDELYTFVQNAETIMLTNKKGEPVRADKLKKGDKVLACVENPHPVGRHFGMYVEDEFIIEK